MIVNDERQALQCWVASGATPHNIARCLLMVDPFFPTLVGLLDGQSARHAAEIAIAVVDLHSSGSNFHAAVTMFDRCVFVDSINRRDRERTAMIITRETDPDILAEAIAACAAFKHSRAILDMIE